MGSRKYSVVRMHFEDGQTRALYHPDNGAIPTDASLQARDPVGRWWPLGRRMRLRIGRFRARRRGSKIAE